MGTTAAPEKPGTAVAKSDEKKVTSVKGLLAYMAPQMKSVLPRHLTPDRQMALVNLIVNKTPKLRECMDTQSGKLSLLTAIMNASRLGLEIGQHAHLVPFKVNGEMQAVMIPDYRGMAELARRSGAVRAIEAGCVYQGDEFTYELGLTPKLVHRPDMKNDTKRTWENLLATYAIGRLPEGEPVFVVLPKWEIAKVRASSRAKDDGPWVAWFERMAMKTAVKRLCNLLPQSPDLVAAIELDNRAETGTASIPLADFDTPEALNEEVKDRTRDRANALSRQLEEQRQIRSGAPESAPPAEEQTNNDGQVGDRRDDMIASLEDLTQADLHKMLKERAKAAGLKDVPALNALVKETIALDSYQAVANAAQAADVLLAIEKLKQE